MLSEADYTEACRRYKDKRTKFSERQRYHALILATQGYAYNEIGRILLVDEETVSQWVTRYKTEGLAGLQNHLRWGGEHGQRCLNTAALAEVKRVLQSEAMPGTQVGSGWSRRAVGQLLGERFGQSYSKSGVRKLLHALGWSYQRGRKLYIRRSPEEQARFILETEEVLARYAASREVVVPFAGDQRTVHSRRSPDRPWHHRGQQGG